VHLTELRLRTSSRKELFFTSILEITYPLSSILTISLAVGLGFYLTRKFMLGWRLYWIGAAIFVLSQVFHIPFNIGLTYLFRNGFLPSPPESWQPIFNAVLLGLSAGVFEETARYAGYRWWAKDARSWSKGLLYGAGHGGMEAILVGSLVLMTFFQLVALRGQDLSTMIPDDQLNAVQVQVAAYWSAAWYDSLLSTLERALTLPVQLCFSIIVLQAFTRRRAYWLVMAILWHAVIDALAVYSARAWGVYVSEAFIAIFALVSILIVFRLRLPEPEPIHESMSSPPSQDRLLRPQILDETPENIEKSRFL
jgi:uncharacterized membrane protein YhfC